MAKDILKEAIADAKAVREVALANAKAALEEAFTPKLQSMLSARLSEDMDEDMDENMDETYMDEEMDEITGMDEEMDEEMMDETYMEGEKEDLDEEIDLEEILNELELEEAKDEDKDVKEAKKDDDDKMEEAKDMDEEKDDMKEAKDDDDDVKKEAKDDDKEMEEAVGYPNYRADQMRKVRHDATDINQGLNENEEFDLDALLEEINNLDEKKDEDDVKEAKKDDKEKVEETYMDEEMDETYMDEEMDENVNPVTGRPFGARSGPSDSSLYMYSLLPKSAAKGMKPEFAKVVGDNEVGSHDEFVKALNAKGMRSRNNFANFKRFFTEAELEETKSALETVKAELNEVNLLNSKLLYVNRIFKANTLDEGQKLRVVETLDKAETAKEAKLIYETIKDTFNVAKSKKASVKTKTKSLKEGIGMASKSAGTSTAPKKEVISESNNMINRFQKLANIKINE